LTVSRWEEFEKLQPRLGFGLDFAGIFSTLNLSIDLANKGKGVEAWNLIYNLKTSVGERLENRIDSAMSICCLFLNREDEDITSVDIELFKEKVSDWKQEGIAAVDFFVLASNLVRGFVEALQTDSPTFSQGKTIKKKSKL
jgi:hypothetical protein